MKTITATNKGIAINYQDTGKSSFIPYAQTPEQTSQSFNRAKFFEMNEIQRKMYRRLLYGVKAFTPEELSSMNESVIFSIEKDHYRAKEAVNKLKYDRFFGAYNKLLSVIFPHVELSYHKDGKYIPMPSLKELKITTFDVIDTWIENKLLPLNFMNLNVETLVL